MHRLVGRRGSVLLALATAGILAGSVGVAPSLGAAPAQLTLTGKPTAINNAYGGLAVVAGVQGSCPDGTFVCSVSSTVTGKGKAKGALASPTPYYIPPGASPAVTVTLSKPAQKLPPKLGQLTVPP